MKVIKAAILFPIALFVLGCAGTATPSDSSATRSIAPSSATNPNGGSLVRAMTSEPGSLDPQGAPNSGLSLVMPYLFDTLVVYDNENRLAPLLAESWQTAPDGKAITMKLKSGVTFQDGTPFNAEAVRFTFQRFKDTGSKSPIYDGVKLIDAVQAVDDLTVRFTFKEPTANFWSTITMPYAGIISPESARLAAANGKGHLIGSGPFILDKWQASQSMTLKRNPAYKWAPPFLQNHAAPYLETVVFKIIPDATTQLAALETGEVDAIFVNQPDQRAKLQANPQIKVEETVLNSLIYLGFNCSKPPFTDPTVRQALSYAVNKDEILKTALGGIGLVAFAPLPPSLPGYDASLKSYELGYDPKKAQTLLKDAGFVPSANGTWEKNGQALKGTLLTSNRAPNDAIAAVLQSQLKAIGVAVDIQTLDSKAVMDATTQGKFDLLLWRYDWNDPDALNIYLGSDRVGNTNRVAYKNSQVDELLTRGAHELDLSKRKQLYVQAQRLILQDAPWQPLYVPLDVIATNKRIHGIQIGFMGRMWLNDARVLTP